LLDPDSYSAIFILVSLLVVHAVFAAARESIVSLRKPRRLQLIDEGHPSAQLVDDFAENATRLLATEQLVLKFLAAFIVALSAFIYTDRLAEVISVSHLVGVIIVTVIAVLITLLFGELIPKEIGRTYAEPLALTLVHPFRWASFVAAPLVKLVSMVGRWLTGNWEQGRNETFTSITEEELRTYVDASEEEGVLKEEEKEMIYSIFDLSDTVVREIMVPRIDMVAVEVNSPAREVLGKILEAGYSRVPVYQDSIDNVVGILYVKDLMGYWLAHNSEPPSIKELIRDVYHVPESKPVSDLLGELQLKRVHIAIVVDEYCGTAGLVTIEDILEENVGEIQDEHDADEFYLEKLSDNVYIFSARMDLDDVNDEMDIKLPTDENDTLGGLVYNSLGRIPQLGDVIDGATFGLPEVRLTVLGVSGRRVGTVKIERLTPALPTATVDGQPEPESGQSVFMRTSQNSVSNL
jgi:putative hemolysin